MGDTAAEARPLAERFVQVQGVVVAGDPGEVDDVLLGDGADVLGALADAEALEGANGGIHPGSVAQVSR